MAVYWVFKGIALTFGHEKFEKSVSEFQKRSRMIPNRSSSLSFQMEFLKNFDRKSDPVGPFISAVEALKVLACKGFSKELFWSLGQKNLKNVFRSSKNDPEWF